MLVENNEIGNTGNEKICKNFHDPLPRNKTRTFKNSAKTYVIVKDKVKTTVEINRNILGALLSFSAKANQPIDFDSALSYPLSPIPLSLALPDGARRETPKSKLIEIILKGASELSDPTVENPFMRRSTAYVLDMIATIRMMKSIPATYEDFTWQFLKMIPKNFKRVDIVADTYRDNSIKSGERLKRGCSSKVIIGSCKSKIPREFSKFMQNGENKTRLI